MFCLAPCPPPGHPSPSAFTPFCLQQPLRLEPFQSWRKNLNAPREHPEAHDQEDGPELGGGVVLRTLALLWEPSAFSASVLLLLLPHYLWEPQFYKGKDCWVRPRPYPCKLLPCFFRPLSQKLNSSSVQNTTGLPGFFNLSSLSAKGPLTSFLLPPS